jgi:hypothetical protein
MKFRLQQDARPQAMTLLVATALSVVLWFIPYAEVLTYPFRIFVTFIHEGGHALAALLTAHTVYSLSVDWTGAGATHTSPPSGLFSQFFIASAGYLGAMAFGALLLVLVRKTVAARIVLLSSAAYVAGLTAIFGLIKPLYAFDSWSGIPFTLFAGAFIALALVLIARFATARVATFFVGFLAVQCVLNALFDLKTVLFLSSPFVKPIPHDAANMAEATGIPALLWASLWIIVAFAILWFVMRLYVAGRDQTFQPDLPFEDIPPVG